MLVLPVLLIGGGVPLVEVQTVRFCTNSFEEWLSGSAEEMVAALKSLESAKVPLGLRMQSAFCD